MIKIFSFFITIFFITGCSKSITIDQLNIQKVQELSMVNTRKGELSNKNSKIFILATYLNPIKTSALDNSKENFLISIYFSEQNNRSKENNNPFYNIRLNKTILMDDIKLVNKNSKLLRLIPIKNRWSEYYIIEFPKQNTKTLKLSFENAQHKKVNLIFSKEL